MSKSRRAAFLGTAAFLSPPVWLSPTRSPTGPGMMVEAVSMAVCRPAVAAGGIVGKATRF
jgi:hypothetical protein